MLLFVALEVFD